MTREGGRAVGSRARLQGEMNGAAHILVVDDDPEIRDLLREYLQENGLLATAPARVTNVVV